MALVTLPRQYTADISGIPRVGAKLFVYDAGTNNTRIVYTTKAYDIELGQPIASMEGGTFPAIYVNPAGGDYKIIIQDESGALIYSEDNLSPSIDTITSSLIATTLDSLKRTSAEISAGVTPVNYAYEPGNVLRYGADPTGLTSSQVAFDAALAVAGDANSQAMGQIIIPAGTFKVGWLIQDAAGDYLWIKTAGFQTRLIPVSSAIPVIDIYASTGGNGVTGLRLESMLIDSVLSGSPSHAGIGLRVRASNPGFVWKCKFEHLYARGFQDGFDISCDINLGELYDNDFDQLEALSCSRYSIKILGIYNRFGKLFATDSSTYAVYSQASHCQIGLIVTDGPVAIVGTACTVNQIVIEGPMPGAGSAVACEINGGNHVIGAVTLVEVQAAACAIGIAVSSTDYVLSSLTVQGTNYPTTPIQLNGGSSGIIGRASIPGGTKITTSTGVISAWRFLGDVSSAYIGDRYLDPNLLIEYSTGRLKQIAGGTTNKRVGITYSATMATDSSLGTHFTITATNGTAFTISNPTNLQDGSVIEYTIYNASGGALGTITWGALFKMSTWTSPANGFNRSIRFRYDGTALIQVSQTGADVPN